MTEIDKRRIDGRAPSRYVFVFWKFKPHKIQSSLFSKSYLIQQNAKFAKKLKQFELDVI